MLELEPMKYNYTRKTLNKFREQAKKAQTGRNLQIYKEWKAGTVMAELTHKWKLSRQRIHQIVKLFKKKREERNKALRASKDKKKTT